MNDRFCLFRLISLQVGNDLSNCYDPRFVTSFHYYLSLHSGGVLGILFVQVLKYQNYHLPVKISREENISLSHCVNSTKSLLMSVSVCDQSSHKVFSLASTLALTAAESSLAPCSRQLITFCLHESMSSLEMFSLFPSSVTLSAAGSFGGNRRGDACCAVKGALLRGKATRLLRLILRFPVGAPTFFGGSFQPERNVDKCDEFHRK